MSELQFSARAASDLDDLAVSPALPFCLELLARNIFQWQSTCLECARPGVPSPEK